MDRTLLVLILSFGCLWLWAEPVPEGAIRHFEGDSLSVEDPTPVFQEGDWALAVGVVPHLTHVTSIGEDSKSWNWRANLSLQLRLFHRFPGPFELQSGISQQNFGSTGHYIHPEPYVLNYDLVLRGKSVRAPLLLNWTFMELPNQTKLYLGAGGLVDLVYYAKLGVNTKYVSGVEAYSRDIREEIGDLIPAFVVQLGSDSGPGRVEISYWRDLQSFNLAERGSAKLHRSGILISYSMEFLQF